MRGPALTISIVIPSLNQGEFLEQALASIVAQRFAAVEIVVMDGGSTDGTRAVLQKYDRMITYWQSQPDHGPAAALNAGFQHTTGEICGVLNADDFFLPGAFETMARAFDADPSADVVSGHGRFADRSGVLGAPTFSDRWSLRRFRYGACVLVQPATFFRREIFDRAGGFNASRRTVCWDMELWARMAAAGARFALVDAQLIAFRLYDSSITGRSDLRDTRRLDARAVMAQVRGRPETAVDRLLHLAFRGLKVAQHPARTLRQRLYFRSVLRRWAL